MKSSLLCISRLTMCVMCVLAFLSCTPATLEPDKDYEQEVENNPAGDKREDENKEELKMKMTVGSYTFDIEYADNKTAEAFKNMLPTTLRMEELNSNEKYCYLGSSLPTASSNPGTIHAGDIMLYSNNCIVVFYETFSTSYSYTRIGKVKDITNLKVALGSGDVSVKFE